MDKEVKKQWIQMGVELEGSWNKDPNTVASTRRGAAFHVDQSVHIGHGNPGEIVTRPHENLDTLIEDVRALWPDMVDVSCGLHIHASFTPMQTMMLATKEFFEYFKESWKTWGKKTVKLPANHEFWNRIAGKNKHARDALEAERQLSTQFKKREERYTMINFHSWEKHRTVENRVLPMFSDIEIAIAAIRHMDLMYNYYLSEHEFKNIRVESPAELDGNVVIESYHRLMPDTSPKEALYEGTFPMVETGPDVFYAIQEAMDEVQPFKVISETQTP